MDFGITADAADLLSDYGVEIIVFDSGVKGWFKKPSAILKATEYADVVCWLDTDCQVMGDISGIFDANIGDRIGMVKDRPWTVRRPENGDWYNSGVVLTKRNRHLIAWARECETNPKQGDQEVLHYMTSPITRCSTIEPLPHTYNSLRLDYIDKIGEINPLILHHTGAKGNQRIREMIKC